MLVLTEFKSGNRGDELMGLLQAAGYPYLIHREQGPKALGTAIASRLPITEIELPIPASTDPWRSVAVRVAGIDVVGFYFPLGDAKLDYWDWVLANAGQLLAHDVILVGDFNTGKRYIDEAGATFDAIDKHEALERLGFVDTWRAAYPKGRDYTWYSSAGNGFRLDYVWASPSLADRVTRIRHDHEGRLVGATDHTAVVAELTL